MPADKLEIRISAAKLLIAMLVVIAPLCAFGLIAMTRADAALERVLRPALASSPELRPTARDLATGLRWAAPTTAMSNAHTTMAIPTDGSTRPLDVVGAAPRHRPTALGQAVVRTRAPVLLWIGIGLVALLAGVLAIPLLDDEPAQAVSAATVYR